jgi:hypothetical protein
VVCPSHSRSIGSAVSGAPGSSCRGGTVAPIPIRLLIGRSAYRSSIDGTRTRSDLQHSDIYGRFPHRVRGHDEALGSVRGPRSKFGDETGMLLDARYDQPLQTHALLGFAR